MSDKKADDNHKDQRQTKETQGENVRRSKRAATKDVEDKPQEVPQKEPKKRGPKAKQDQAPTQSENKLTKKQQKLAEQHDITQLQDIGKPSFNYITISKAQQLRILSIKSTNASNSGHPTSCASMAEVLSVLFFDPSGMHYDPQDPKNFANDRFVLSKGHAAPILYAAWSIAGLYTEEQLLNLRKIDSDLEGHPTPKLPFVDVATGSLGQGLSVAGGMAYSSKYLDKVDNRFWVVIGDGESAEGSIWEACNLAAYYKLNNLTLIVDVNRLGQSQGTILEHEINVYAQRFEAFGWAAYKIDGHNIYEIIETFEKCRNTNNQPQVIIAKTYKGKYFPEIENIEDWHGKPLGKEKGDVVINHLHSLQKTQTFNLKPVKPAQADLKWPTQAHLELGPLNYTLGAKVATRKAYGSALVNLSKNDALKQIVALDADTKNSTFSITYKEAVPTNFIECFIAEQNLVGWAQGLSCRRKVSFASTFACFFTRAFDQARMGGISDTSMNFVGSHCGVSIGQDGPSQMGLEDLALFRSIPECLVLYPCDAVSTEKAVQLAANYKHTAYIRTSRPDTPVIYKNEEHFEIGKCKIVKSFDHPCIVIVAAGVTLHEALKASSDLEKENYHLLVIDVFSVKPIDSVTILEMAQKSSSKTILTVEDHYLQGGIFESVCGAISYNHNGVKVIGLGVTSVPRSGQPNELLERYHIDSKGIIAKVKELLG